MTKSKFIMHYLLLNKFSYLLAIVCIFIVNYLQVEIPRYIQLAVDLLNQSTLESKAGLVENVEWVIALSVVMVVVRILSRMYALNPGRITEAALKNDVFHRLNRLPSTFHDKFASGKLISIINNDLNGIRLFYGIGFLQLFNILFALSLTPIWMWKISPELTLYSVIPIAIAAIIFRIGFRKLRALHAERLNRLQDLSEQLMNYLSGIDLIKNQQMGDWVTNEVNKVNRRLYDCTMQIAKIQTIYMPILDYANHFMKVLILGLGGYYLLQAKLTIGEITAFLSYSVLLALPLMHLGRIVTVYQMGMISIDSVQNILNNAVPSTDMLRMDDNEKSALRRSTLSVQNLSYGYPNAKDKQSQMVLKDLSFSIEPGEKVGVLGSIGAGKSTLVNCLNHHLSLDPGQIFWGDKDITQVSRQDWRSYVRTITQDPFLFSATISENVKFGAKRKNQDVDELDVAQVLELSQLQEDVQRFGARDQTLVGEKGIMLSGGQKQRLSIARALLTPSDLIIMDNVLSAVDYETERTILKGVFNRIQEQSLLVVSHRVSALEYMDKILVLEQGEIIARGTHAELLESSSYYRQTWELQQHESEASA
ncbi:ABC transporter ATP-binding protein [Paraglaciecola polaris]|uniref:ATP-binding cassette, subfamily B, bacterial n=1 Tax=Paraglaciecola polaris LMG 21857 TaxID=1129793 RepID=K6ZKY4_9ALTE|nr:ABC transporter ATP-binding protein [Paraglaciecola polaris]GAC30982.1 ATP-binding cassette, subfamily B, bacterial [Paraglaciecola polaris LMG 21857]